MDKRLLAKAVYDNVAETPNELAFRRGDVLTVLDQNLDAAGWWLCSFRGKQGLAPGNRLRLLAGAYSPSILSSPASSVIEDGASVRSSTASAGSTGEYDMPKGRASPATGDNRRTSPGTATPKGMAGSRSPTPSGQATPAAPSAPTYDVLPPARTVAGVTSPMTTTLSQGVAYDTPRHGRQQISPAPSMSSVGSVGSRARSPLSATNSLGIGGTYDVPVPSAAATLSLQRRKKTGGDDGHASPVSPIRINANGRVGGGGLGVSHQRSRSNDSGLTGGVHGHIVYPGLPANALAVSGEHTVAAPFAVGGAPSSSAASNRSSIQSFVSSSSSPPDSLTSGSVRSSAFDSDAYDIPQSYQVAFNKQTLVGRNSSNGGAQQSTLPGRTGTPPTTGRVPTVGRPKSDEGLVDYDVPRSRRLPNSPLPPLPPGAPGVSTPEDRGSLSSLTSGRSTVGAGACTSTSTSASGSLAASVIEDIYDKPVPSKKYLLNNGADGEFSEGVSGSATPRSATSTPTIASLSSLPPKSDYDVLPPAQSVRLTGARDSELTKTDSRGSLQSGGSSDARLAAASISPASSSDSFFNRRNLNNNNEEDAGSSLTIDVDSDEVAACPMDQAAAREYLSRAQGEVDMAAARLLRFVTPFWRTRDSLEPVVYDIKLSCLGLESTLHDFVEFAESARKFAPSGSAATRQLTTTIRPVVSQWRTVERSMRRLGAAKWALSKLQRPDNAAADPSRSKGSGTPDDLGLIVGAAQEVPTLVGIAVAVAQSNLSALFSEQTGTTNASGSLHGDGESTERLSKTLTRTSLSNESTSSGSSVSPRSPRDTSSQPNGNGTLGRKRGLDTGYNGATKVNGEVKDMEEVEATWYTLSANDKQHLAHYMPYVEEIRNSVTDVASKMLNCLHQPVASTPQPNDAGQAQMFVALSRDAVTRAHRLVFIGETLSRHVSHAGVQRGVVERANELCECLKSLITRTKEAALGAGSQRTAAAANLEKEVGELRRVMGTFAKALSGPLSGSSGAEPPAVNGSLSAPSPVHLSA